MTLHTTRAGSTGVAGSRSSEGNVGVNLFQREGVREDRLLVQWRRVWWVGNPSRRRGRANPFMGHDVTCGLP